MMGLEVRNGVFGVKGGWKDPMVVAAGRLDRKVLRWQFSGTFTAGPPIRGDGGFRSSSHLITRSGLGLPARSVSGGGP